MPQQRACADCGAPITPQAKTGYCRTHANARMHADPGYQARRQAGLDAHYAKAGVRDATYQRLRAGLLAKAAADPDGERARRKAHGEWLRREVLTPELIAKSQTPEARRRAAAACSETRMGWCPAELRPRYFELLKRKRLPAAEARRMIEALIPGTTEHARREIDSRRLAQQLRHERDRAEAY